MNLTKTQILKINYIYEKTHKNLMDEDEVVVENFIPRIYLKTPT